MQEPLPEAAENDQVQKCDRRDQIPGEEAEEVKGIIPKGDQGPGARLLQTERG